MRNIGVQSTGIKCPIIKEGDDLVKIVVDSILKSTVIDDNDDLYFGVEPQKKEKRYELYDGDIVGVLVASLMDLTSGSGDRGTYVVMIH